MQLALSVDHSRTMPLKHGGHCVRALRCHQGKFNKRRQHIAYSVFRFIPTCFAYSFIRVYDIDTHNNLVLLSLMRYDITIVARLPI